MIKMTQERGLCNCSHVNPDTLSDKIKQLEEMSQMMAHNLRGPAANIKMLTEILQDKEITETSRDTTDSLFPADEVIRCLNESSAALLRTLDTLMELATIKQDEKVKFERCDIAEIVGHVSDQLNGYMHHKNATITLDLAVKHIDYPIAYMESILYNFMSNSIKYSRPDVEANVTISTYKHNDKMLLSVRDNGLGINLSAHGQRIFNLHEVFHSGYDSKGVGLYITRQQIESLGSTVDVRSKVDEGTEFIVAF